MINIFLQHISQALSNFNRKREPDSDVYVPCMKKALANINSNVVYPFALIRYKVKYNVRCSLVCNFSTSSLIAKELRSMIIRSPIAAVNVNTGVKIITKVCRLARRQ